MTIILSKMFNVVKQGVKVNFFEELNPFIKVL